MLRPHLRFRLLVQAGKKLEPGYRKRRQQGSIALLLLAALAITVGSLAIANSSSNSLLRSAFQGDSREAREAALAGIDTIISDLNRFENRRLLVTKVNLNDWDSTIANVCPNPPPGTTYTPTATTTYGKGAISPLTKDAVGNTTRDFRLVSVQKIADKGRAHTITSFGLATDGTSPTPPNSTYDPLMITIYKIDPTTNTGSVSEDYVGYIRLTVEGRLWRNRNNKNEVVATSTVTREFEIVPKCCNQSFGLPIISNKGVHGSDVRICGSTNAQAGLVVGFNGGVISAKGTSADLYSVNSSGTPVKLDNVLCVENEVTGQNCDTLLASKQNPIDTSLGDVPILAWNTVQVPPTYPGTQATGARIVDNAPNTGKGEIQVQCLRSTSAGVQAFQIYDATTKTCNTPVTDFEANYCKLNDPSTAPGFNNCLIESITYTGNNNLVIQTASRNTRLFITGDTKFSGGFDNGLVHQRDTNNDGTFESLTEQECSTSGSAFVDGLQIYDTAADPEQTISIGSGGGNALGFFLWAPYSTVTLNGNPTLCGKLWVNTLEYSGNVTLVTPPTSSDGNGDGIPDSITPLQDWIARSTKGFRGF